MSETPSSSAASRTILVVEDNDIYRQVLCAGMERRFPTWEIVPAASLAAARQCIGSRALHVAVTDLSLPDGSGVELVPFLAADLAKGLKLVALTNDSAGDVLPGLKLLGYHGFVAKEHGLKALCDAVEAVLDGREVVSQLS